MEDSEKRSPLGKHGSATEQRANKLDVQPSNPEHLARLLDFAREILEVCDSLAIEPVASGSLAVLLYTKDPAIEIHDIDLSCSENDFPHLLTALAARGIAASVTDWHVLQARRDDLKVEFDSREYWMTDVPEDYEIARVGGFELKIVSRRVLVELYRRGLEATADSGEAANPQKQRSIRDKLTRLQGSSGPELRMRGGVPPRLPEGQSEQELQTLADDLGGRFPEVRPIAPLTLVGSGFESVVIETASGVVFKVARDPQTGSSFRFERALLNELATSLPVALPAPQWQAFDLPSAPYGVSGYRKLSGTPLEAEQLTGARAQALSKEIAGFLVALHRVRPADLDMPIPRSDPRLLLTQEFCGSVRSILSSHATRAERRVLVDWFVRAPRELSSSRPPVVTHGDLWYENLLVEPGPRLSGVLDWSGVALSEPARDIAPLTYNGAELLTATIDVYADATGQDATELRTKAHAFLLLRELIGLHWAERNDQSELPDAINKVLQLLQLRQAGSASARSG